MISSLGYLEWSENLGIGETVLMLSLLDFYSFWLHWFFIVVMPKSNSQVSFEEIFLSFSKVFNLVITETKTIAFVSCCFAWFSFIF